MKYVQQQRRQSYPGVTNLDCPRINCLRNWIFCQIVTRRFFIGKFVTVESGFLTNVAPSINIWWHPAPSHPTPSRLVPCHVFLYCGFYWIGYVVFIITALYPSELCRWRWLVMDCSSNYPTSFMQGEDPAGRGGAGLWWADADCGIQLIIFVSAKWQRRHRPAPARRGGGGAVMRTHWHPGPRFVAADGTPELKSGALLKSFSKYLNTWSKEINLISWDTRNELQKLRVQRYFDTKISLTSRLSKTRSVPTNLKPVKNMSVDCSPDTRAGLSIVELSPGL